MRTSAKLHRRRTDESGDKAVGRFVVKLHRVADLLYPAVAHDDDPVAQGHRLDLVVGDVDRGRCQAAQRRLFQLRPASARAAWRKPQVLSCWLVEQKDLRMPNDRAAQGDALALPARQLARLALQQLLDAEDLGQLPAPALAISGLFEFPHFETEGHVVVDAHMRVERVVPGTPSRCRGSIGSSSLTIFSSIEMCPEVDAPRAPPPCARSSSCRSPDGPTMHDEFLVVDVEVDVDDGDAPRRISC